VTKEQLDEVKPFMTEDTDVGNLLLMMGMISEEDLCRARSLHAGVISGKVEIKKVKQRIVRTLPRHVIKKFGVLPVSVTDGRLLVAGADVPEASLFDELRKFTSLPIDFQLITKSNFDELVKLA
jgi:type IV pilus assembly protein PilB